MCKVSRTTPSNNAFGTHRRDGLHARPELQAATRGRGQVVHDRSRPQGLAGGSRGRVEVAVVPLDAVRQRAAEADEVPVAS